MKIVDWRQVDARALALVFARERARWLVELWWDTREAWTQVECARSTWGLPGLAAVDDGGRVRGLTFFHADGARFEMGGVFAESEPVRLALLDGAIAVCEEAGGDEIRAFAYAGVSSTAGVFESRGFAVEGVDYLSLDLGAADGAGPVKCLGLSVRGWQDGDVEQVGALLHASYDAASARRFVADGSAAGWRTYVGNLVKHAALGRILPDATRIASAGDRLVGAVLATDLGPATAHIPQVAIHPQWRRKGLAGALVDDAARRLRTSGYARVTLMASASNRAAQVLYRKRGFVEAGTFISALRLRDPAVARAS